MPKRDQAVTFWDGEAPVLAGSSRLPRGRHDRGRSAHWACSRPRRELMEVNLAQALTDFDTGLLLTLDALFKDQNVTHAATRLNITQSALSARLTRLRQLLNDP